MNQAKIELVQSSIRFPLGYDPVESFQSQKAGGACRPGLVDPGLRRLMLALLEDALDSYRKYFSKPSRKNEICFREVEQWLLSEADHLFSFENVCDSLGIGPGWLRRKILSWKEERLHGGCIKG